jgi:hypothetical protein
MKNTNRLPAWLLSQLQSRATYEYTVSRSETVEQMHDRVKREHGLVWDEATREWIKA